MSEADIRIAVLENRIDTLQDMFKETHVAVLSIKERLDKTNGAIPHMAEDIKNIRAEIKTVADSLAVKTTDLAETLAAKTIEDTKSQTKFNILWGVIACLLTSIVVALASRFLK